MQFYQMKKEENLINSFLGDGEYSINKKGELTLNQLIGFDNVIIETPDVRRAFFSNDSVGNVLVVGQHKGVYLKSWQTLKVKYKDSEGNRILTYLVNIRRGNLRPYNFADHNIVDIGEDGGFSGFDENFSKSLNFELFRMTAERQTEEKRKYEVIS